MNVSFGSLTTSKYYTSSTSTSSDTSASNLFNESQKTGDTSASKSKPSKEEIEQKLKSLGIPESVIKQGPDAVKKYASENGITLPQPPSDTNSSSQYSA